MYCVFASSFPGVGGQTAGLRWVWQVIPLHLQYPSSRRLFPAFPTDCQSVAEQTMSPSSSFSSDFPRVFHQKHIMCHYFILPSLPVNGGPRQWANAVVFFIPVQYAKERSSVLNLQDVTGAVMRPRARDLLSNKKWDTYRDDPASRCHHCLRAREKARLPHYSYTY